MKKLLILFLILFISSISYAANQTAKGGEGITITSSGTGGNLTWAGENATTGAGSGNKGIASFDSSNFSDASGHIVIKDGGVADEELANESFGDFTCTGVDDQCTLNADVIAIAEFTASADLGDMSVNGAGDAIELDTGVVSDNEIDYTNVKCDDLTMDNCDSKIKTTSDLEVDGTITAGSGDIAITDATGNLDGEQIIADSIDDDSIDFTVGVGLSCVDITMTDCGAVTSSGTVTAAVGFDCTGAADCDFGSDNITDMFFDTDGAGDGEIELPNDSIGDAEIDWEGLTASHLLTVPDLTITTGNNLIIGTTQWDSAAADTINGAYLEADSVDALAIDWGSGANQIDLGDIPGGTAPASAFNFGAATDLEIPQDQTVNVDGEITVDGTTGQFRYHDGTAERVVSYQKELCVTLENPVEADDNIPFFTPRRNITVTDIVCRVDTGTSINLTISNGTDEMEVITCGTAASEDDGDPCDGTDPTYCHYEALERIEFDLSSPSGTQDWLNFCITYTIDAD